MKVLKAIVRFFRGVIFGTPLTREQQMAAQDVQRDRDGYKYSQHSIQSQGNGLGNGF